MQNPLENLTIKLCEKLPLDFTIYERDGFCKKPNEDCDYCRWKDGSPIEPTKNDKPFVGD